MQRLILLLVYLMLLSCKSRQTHVLAKSYTKPLSEIVYHLDTSYPVKNYDFRFREQAVNIRNENYLVYLTKAKELVFKNFDTIMRPQQKLDAAEFISNENKFINISLDDTVLSFLNTDKGKIYRLIIDKHFKTISKDSISYNDAFDTSVYFIRTNTSQSIRLLNDNYFLSLGKDTKRSKFLDRFLYFRYRMHNDQKSERIIETPLELRKGKRSSANTYLFFVNDTGYCFFEQLDKAILFEVATGTQLKTVEFNPYCDYESYDYQQRRDLGYFRNYLELNGFNENIVLTQKYIIIIKRIKRKSVLESRQLEYMILDHQFKIVAYNKFNHKVHPRIVFGTDNGFIIADINLKDAYSYTIN